MIGGMVSWDPAGTAPPVSALRAMASRLPGGRAPIVAEQGTLGLFSSAEGQWSASDGEIWAVADVDLTNLSELHALVESPDRERSLLPALYRREGPYFLRRLHGAFALALWDSRERSLLLAVDRFGMRRLHYASDVHRVAFASSPSALQAAPGVEGRVNLTAVYTYLNFGYVPAPRSIFADISRVEPGQFLLLRHGRSSVTHYWDMRYAAQPIDETEAARLLYARTEEAVRETLFDASAKDTGTFLSGGTDSSAVLGLATRTTGERMRAFSIGFTEDRYNELGYAELAARHFDALHHTHLVGPLDALKLLPRLVDAFDEPFGNNSAIGTLACAQLAADNGVTLLLAGDGGDEIFGGNERYRVDRIFAAYHRIPSLLRRRLLEPVLFRLPDWPGPIGSGQRYVRRANIPNPERFYSYEFFFTRGGHALLAPDFEAAVASDTAVTVLREHYGRAQADAELNRLLYLDLKLSLGDNDLLKVTRTAQLADVRVRFPLLDSSLVEFTALLPVKYKVRGLEKRYLFKRAFRDLLPPPILAKTKHGFGIPTSVWLKTHNGFRELAHDTLLSSRSLQRGYFRKGAIEQLFADHAADSTPYYGDILWTVLMLELWHRRHVDASRAA
jgi:asparagine synthase (glutamine-hydrolysing)